MSEFSQHLPFSQRPRQDESTVTNNWASHSATVLGTLTDILEGLSEAQWHSISRRTGLRAEEINVRTIVAEFLWSAQSRKHRLNAIMRAVISKRFLPAQARTALIQMIAEQEPTSLMEEMRGLVAARLNSDARGGIGELGNSVATLFEIAEVTGHPVNVDPAPCGAVAIAASLTAPLAIRAVLDRCEISVSDDLSSPATGEGWRVGRGRKTTASPAAIVLFLYGRRAFPAPAGR